MPWSRATSLTARFVVVTAAATFTFNRVVTLARAGSWALVSVNERRSHRACEHAKRRLRTNTTSGTGPCGRSFTRLVGRSLITPDITPQAGQPPCSATLSTKTRWTVPHAMP